VSRHAEASLALSVALLALPAGCFYTDSINQRPSIDIRQTSSDEVFRGSDVALMAESDDPEGHVVFYSWRAYACTETEALPSGERPGCDQVPFHTGVLATTDFVVPVRRVDEDVPVEAVLVILQAQDDYGAIARPDQQLVIPVGNHPPTLDLAMRPRNGYVVDTKIDIYAKYGDPDDGAASLTDGIKSASSYKLFTPMNQPSQDIALIDVADPDAPAFLQEGWVFTPGGVGRWEFQLTATDPLGAVTSKSLIIDVVPDHAPCLAQWAPIAAPSATTEWPMTDPTLFQVKVVQDDLDPYPTVPGDAELGTTAFTWSIKQPGAGSRTPLGVTGNAVSLDPANYTPGDIVELRVEIADRKATPITCADSSLTCSVISDNACIQRLTWRVVVN
jgi:hypothetical protein